LAGAAVALDRTQVRFELCRVYSVGRHDQEHDRVGDDLIKGDLAALAHRFLLAALLRRCLDGRRQQCLHKQYDRRMRQEEVAAAAGYKEFRCASRIAAAHESASLPLDRGACDHPMTQTAPHAYDAVTYPGVAFEQTHPDRL